MDARVDFKALMDSIVNQKLIESMEQDSTQSKSKELVLLFNKYGIYGADVLSFLAELVTTLKGEQNEDKETNNHTL